MAPRLAKTRATSAGGGDGGGSSGEGARTATSLLDTAEQSVEQLERAVG